MNVDVISFLKEQMKKNTKHYQSDYLIDEEIIKKYANSYYDDEKTLLWLSRPMGTLIGRERETFIKGTYENNTWQVYLDSPEEIVAYAVELLEIENGVVKGNVYELDYETHAKEVAEKSIPSYMEEKTFQDGFKKCLRFDEVDYFSYAALIDAHGLSVRSKTYTKDEKLLDLVLKEQKQKRDKMKMPSLNEQVKNAASKCEGLNKDNHSSKEKDLKQYEI